MCLRGCNHEPRTGTSNRGVLATIRFSPKSGSGGRAGLAGGACMAPLAPLGPPPGGLFLMSQGNIHALPSAHARRPRLPELFPNVIDLGLQLLLERRHRIRRPEMPRNEI